jgi:hypothetical protein
MDWHFGIPEMKPDALKKLNFVFFFFYFIEYQFCCTEYINSHFVIMTCHVLRLQVEGEDSFQI